ncbi:MAG: tetratricopeptide repeat protein, partial [Planctomycetaceae bacterium]|nr:tetratricopeptide repeat protein [Planctomycetaceae bacterium]
MSRRHKPSRKLSPPNPSTPQSAPVPAHNTRPLVVAGLAIFITLLLFASVSNSSIRKAELALSRGNYREALDLANKELQSHPLSGRALAVAGSACLARNDPAAAVAYLKRVPDDEKQFIGVLQSQLGRLAFEASRVSEAEERFRESLKAAPNDPTTLDQLIFLLALEGRTWEARQLILERLRSGTVNSNYMILVSSRKSSLANPTEFAKGCLAAVPNDPLPFFALANQAWRDNEPAEARNHLEKVLRKYPQSVDAHSLLFEVLVETGTTEEVENQRDRLPPAADERSDVWLSKGIWA